VRRGFVIPIAPSTPPRATSAEQIATASWKARTDSAFGGERIADEHARHDDAYDRHTHETCDACDRVVERRCDASIILVGVGEHGAYKRDRRN
jgi:hypothetical protein